MTLWMDLLKDAVATAGSKKAVAERLGISRSQVSTVMHGNYKASTEHIARKVLDVYGRIQCPHLGVDITQADCRSNHARPAPTSSPREMKFWRACQVCSHNTENEKNLNKNPVNG